MARTKTQSTGLALTEEIQKARALLRILEGQLQAMEANDSPSWGNVSESRRLVETLESAAVVDFYAANNNSEEDALEALRSNY